MLGSAAIEMLLFLGVKLVQGGDVSYRTASSFIKYHDLSDEPYEGSLPGGGNLNEDAYPPEIHQDECDAESSSSSLSKYCKNYPELGCEQESGMVPIERILNKTDCVFIEAMNWIKGFGLTYVDENDVINSINSIILSLADIFHRHYVLRQMCQKIVHLRNALVKVKKTGQNPGEISQRITDILKNHCSSLVRLLKHTVNRRSCSLATDQTTGKFEYYLITDPDKRFGAPNNPLFPYMDEFKDSIIDGYMSFKNHMGNPNLPVSELRQILELLKSQIRQHKHARELLVDGLNAHKADPYLGDYEDIQDDYESSINSSLRATQKQTELKDKIENRIIGAIIAEYEKFSRTDAYEIYHTTFLQSSREKLHLLSGDNMIKSMVLPYSPEDIGLFRKIEYSIAFFGDLRNKKKGVNSEYERLALTLGAIDNFLDNFLTKFYDETVQYTDAFIEQSILRRGAAQDDLSNNSYGNKTQQPATRETFAEKIRTESYPRGFRNMRREVARS